MKRLRDLIDRHPRSNLRSSSDNARGGGWRAGSRPAASHTNLEQRICAFHRGHPYREIEVHHL
jgi:hypothetical protein